MAQNIIPDYPNYFEQAAWHRQLFICGIDQVGRGCLAGPLVVAATILPINVPHHFADSKKLTKKQRELSYLWLKVHSLSTIVSIAPYHIDRNNIYQATLYAMKKVCLQLHYRYPHQYARLHAILVDAMPLSLPPMLPKHPLFYFNNGETYSCSIAAASIIAKVTRDRLMMRINNYFPHFSFAQNKGYGSSAHCMTLRQRHATLIHRATFIKKIMSTQEHNEQASIFCHSAS